MLILPQFVNVYVYSNTVHYVNLGYDVHPKDRLTVPVDDLPSTSSAFVRCRCDVCGAEFPMRYYLWMRHQGYPLPLDTCSSPACRREKRRRLSQLRHGVDHPTQTAEVRKKMGDTLEANLGVRCAFQSKEVQQRMAATNLARYGNEVYVRTDDHHRKTAKTCLERFGTPSAASAPIVKARRAHTLAKWTPAYRADIQRRREETNLARRGARWPFSTPAAVKRCAEVLMEHCSKQQRFLHKLLGGQLEYPVGKWRLDVAWPERMVYLEYDGGGHDLCVRRGVCSAEAFAAHGRRRYGALCAQGWRLLRIVSPHDLLPDPVWLYQFIDQCLRTDNTCTWRRLRVVENGVQFSSSNDDELFEHVTCHSLHDWAVLYNAFKSEYFYEFVGSGGRKKR